VQERDELVSRKNKIQESVSARFAALSAQYEAQWVRPALDRYGTDEVFPEVEARFVRIVAEGHDINPTAKSGYMIDELEIWTSGGAPRNVALQSAGGRAIGDSRQPKDFAQAYSAALVNDGKFGARWIAAGPELTIELAQPSKIGRVVFSSDRRRSLEPQSGLVPFVGEYRIEVSCDGASWAEVASSYDRAPPSESHREHRLFRLAITGEEKQELAHLEQQLADVNAKIAAIGPLRSWWVGEFRADDGPFHVFGGGSPSRPIHEVEPASPDFLGDRLDGFVLPRDSAESARRLALADWIVSPENPLTPRVLANRLWHYHFGTGLVDTPSDLGKMGSRPTHPELLDWLAGQVHKQHWRLKPLHRLIVLSQSYRQASSWRSEPARADSDGRLLWRFPPRRLAGEEIRDTLLVLADELDTHMGGPGFRLYEYLEDNVATYVPLASPGTETFRRAVYHQNARAAHVDLMSDFDCPDPAFAVPRRASTTTPLQSLTMMNHRFTMDMARSFADRLAQDKSANESAQVCHAFLAAYARAPDESELKASLRLVYEHGLAAFCRAVLNSSELIYVE
jgi:hypothetical protein